MPDKANDTLSGNNDKLETMQKLVTEALESGVVDGFDMGVIQREFDSEISTPV